MPTIFPISLHVRMYVGAEGPYTCKNNFAGILCFADYKGASPPIGFANTPVIQGLRP